MGISRPSGPGRFLDRSHTLWPDLRVTGMQRVPDPNRRAHGETWINTASKERELDSVETRGKSWRTFGIGEDEVPRGTPKRRTGPKIEQVTTEGSSVRKTMGKPPHRSQFLRVLCFIKPRNALGNVLNSIRLLGHVLGGYAVLDEELSNVCMAIFDAISLPIIL